MMDTPFIEYVVAAYALTGLVLSVMIGAVVLRAMRAKKLEQSLKGGGDEPR